MTSLEKAKQLEAIDRPIAFNRVYKTITGSTNAALMLSQAVYWSKRTKKSDGWFYKTQEEWEDETGLTRYEQETARRILKSLNVLNEKFHGMPAKLYFCVNFERLYELVFSSNVPPIFRQPSNPACDVTRMLDNQLAATPHIGCGNAATLSGETPQPVYPINTEITTEITTENTYKPHSCFSVETFDDSTTESVAPLGASDLTTPEFRSTVERRPSANTPPNPPSRRRAAADYDAATDERIPAWFPREVWRDFCEHRRSIKHPLTRLAVSHIVKDLERWFAHHTQEAIVEAVRLSIKSGWRGVFEPKSNNKHPMRQAIAKPMPLTPNVEMKYDVDNLDYNDPQQVQWYLENFVSMEGTWGRK